MSTSVWEPLGFPDAVEMENAGVAQVRAGGVLELIVAINVQSLFI